jgi:hypothetical protein
MKRPLETRRPARNRGLGKDQEVGSAHARPECPGAPQKRPRKASPVDFDEINRAALAAFPAVLARILPGGKRIGAEVVARKPHQHQPTR